MKKTRYVHKDGSASCLIIRAITVTDREITAPEGLVGNKTVSPVRVSAGKQEEGRTCSQRTGLEGASFLPDSYNSSSVVY